MTSRRAVGLALLLLVAATAAAVEPPDPDILAPPPAPWIEEQVWDGVAHFLYTHPARLERYDLELRTWIDPVMLPQTPNVFAVDDDGIYVGLRGGEIQRLDSGGVFVNVVGTLGDTPTELAVVGDVLYASDREDTSSFIKWTGVLIDSIWDTLYGWSVAPGIGRIFGIGSGNFSYIELLPYGQLGDRPYPLGISAAATATWVHSGETLVVDDAGRVFHANDREQAGEIGGPFQDLDLSGDAPIVLRDDRLVAYSPTYHRTGEVTLPVVARQIAVHGDEVAVFHLGASGVEVLWQPIAALNPADPAAEIRPEGLVFEPQAVAVDHRGIVYLLNRHVHSIFRYSIPQGTWLTTIALDDAPRFMAYASTLDRLYLAYPNREEVTHIRIQPGGTPLAEVAFRAAGGTIFGLIAADDHLVVPTQFATSRLTHRVFDSSATLISEGDMRFPAEQYEWSPTARRVFRLSDSVSPVDLYADPISVDGVIGTEIETPYHGDYSMQYPIRVKADGARVLLGSGILFTGADLTWVIDFGLTHLDAVWRGDDIVTLHPDGDDTKLRLRTLGAGLQHTNTATGSPLHLQATGTETLLITSSEGRPRFSVWDDSLTNHDLLVTVTDDTETAPAGSAVTYRVTVEYRNATAILAGIRLRSQPDARLTQVSWDCSQNGASQCDEGQGTGAMDEVVRVGDGGGLEYIVTAVIDASASGTLAFRAWAEPMSGPVAGDTDLTEIAEAAPSFFDWFETGDLVAWTGSTP